MIFIEYTTRKSTGIKYTMYWVPTGRVRVIVMFIKRANDYVFILRRVSSENLYLSFYGWDGAGAIDFERRFISFRFGFGIARKITINRYIKKQKKKNARTL